MAYAKETPRRNQKKTQSDKKEGKRGTEKEDGQKRKRPRGEKE